MANSVSSNARDFELELEKQISDIRAGRSTTLDLSSHKVGKLDTIPIQVSSLRDLQHLILRGQNIRQVPPSIIALPKLQTLNLIGCPIHNVPNVNGLLLDWEPYVASLGLISPENVIGLHISFGRDQERRKPVIHSDLLISELRKLRHIRELAIRTEAILVETGDQPGPPLLGPPADITPVLRVVGEFKNLTRLILMGAQFQTVPSGVRRLEKLESLYISGLSKLPDWITELTCLTNVLLTGGTFSEVPPPLFRMKQLRRIDLHAWRNGTITTIPESVLHLPNLERLDVQGHPIQTPPPEVVENGVEAIKDYWRQRRDVGIDYLCEAKVLIVGEGGAGKTSLAKKLLDSSYVLENDESSTEGINIGKWQFPFGLRTKEDGVEKIQQQQFTANLWDFGGQEIYHATHQFFLSRRSLYLLVADNRKEDTDFNYWLQVVELLGGDSPLLIVQNEKQNRRRDVDLSTMRSRFLNIRQSYRINLADNRGLDELQSAIQRELEQLPHVGTALPKTWTRVRQALERDRRNYISAEEYYAVCDQHGFKRLDDKLQLSGYLHDLGICLHFQRDPQLKRILFLTPNWATDAVYRVLDDEHIQGRQGRFCRADLNRIWCEEDLSSVVDELIRLMENFHLCYALPSGEEFIAPQLLSPLKPEYAWDMSYNLVVRYEYDFLPKGLVAGAIVTLHHLIADQRLVWRRGVVLERAGTRAEILEDYSRRSIMVRVVGSDPRSLLAIVDDQLDRLHATFPRLRVEKYLPCRCEICRTRNEPSTFSLHDLADFARSGDGIQCRASRKLVDARDLIRDVLPDAYDKYRVEVSEQAAGRPDAEPEKAVYISYSWAKESSKLVDEIEHALRNSGISVMRDRNELKYKDPIRAFMQQLGRGKAVVVVLSRDYLESKSCMFELTEIAKNGEFRKRVFPIVLDDSGIYDPLNRLQYIKFWEAKKKALDDEIRSVGAEYLKGIQEEINLYTKIRITLDELLNILGDMNALSLTQLKSNAFAEIIRALD